MEEKVSLPKKTKIAAQWINFLAGIGIAGILGLGIIFPLIYKPGNFEKIFEKVSPTKYFLGIVFGLVALIFLFWSSLQLMRGKKWAWWVCVVYFFILSVGDIIARKISFEFLITFIPLILLLLDRKNFWKVAK